MWHSMLKLCRPTSARNERQASRRSPRLRLEQLEDRSVPSTFNAATVSDLIADINAANLAGGNNTIVLAANTTFDLTAVNNTTDGANGLPVIAKYDSLAIAGQGGDIIQRDAAAPAFRLLDVAAGASLTLQNLTLQSGRAVGSGASAEGGGIYNQGTLVLRGVTVQGNVAAGSSGVTDKNGNGASGASAAGGGIYSNGTLTLDDGTVVQGNSVYGGPGGGGATLFTSGPGGSGGDGSGGGLYVGGGTVTLTNTTLSQNGAYGGAAGGGFAIYGKHAPNASPGNGYGGALYVANGTVTLNSDTVDYNAAGRGGVPVNGYGGGLYANGGSITLLNDTVEFNFAIDFGGGIYIGNAKVCLDAFTVANVINNTAPVYPDIYGSYTIC